MSKRLNDSFWDSDSESAESVFCNHVSSFRGVKRAIKGGRAVSFSGSAKKGKCRKNSTSKQRMLPYDSLDEDSIAPLTRDAAKRTRWSATPR